MTRLRLLPALVCLLFASGCQTAEPMPPGQQLIARFFLELRPGMQGVRVQLPVSKVSMIVSPKPVLVEQDIINVQLAKVDLGWCLHFQFSSAAARDLYRLSSANLGGRLVLALNGAAVGARVIDQAVPDGRLMIFVEVPNEELSPIAERLNRTSAALAKKEQ